MSKRIYRICLILVMMAAIVTAVIWYQNCKNEKIDGNGLLVMEDLSEVTGRMGEAADGAGDTLY